VGKALPTVFHWNAAVYTWAAPAILRMANLAGEGPWPVHQEGPIHRSGLINLGGNVREWCWNEINRENERLILGGGWSDPPYAFNDAYAQPVFDRSAINGFRCIQRVGAPPADDPLRRRIDLPFRDFSTETPVGDDAFAYILTQFAYDKTDLDARIEDERDEGDWVRQTVTFDAAYGDERVMAYLWLPTGASPPYQTLVHFPGSSAIHQRVSEPNLSIDRIDYFLKSGRALMLPIYKGTYERGGELTTDQPNETVDYRDHVVMWAKDLARSIDYLESREDIDATKLAYWGTSWGGRMGPLMLAVEKRLAVGMLYVAGLKFQRALPEADPFNFATRVTQPVLMVGARYDFFFPMETSQRPLYEWLGTPAEHKRWVVYDGGHAVPRNKLIQETLGWLDRYLGTVE
jgi:dienelactone hydrolase